MFGSKNHSTLLSAYLFVGAVCCYHGNRVGTLCGQLVSRDGDGRSFLRYHGDCAAHRL